MAQTEYPEKLSKLIEEFRSLGDPELRTQMLIEYGESWQPIDESIAVRPYPETHRVPACESEAFLFTEDLPNGTLRYHFAIENPQGISAMAMASIID